MGISNVEVGVTNWLKSIQSVGRGFRPGIEINMISGGTGTGKSVFMDIESGSFDDWTHRQRPHYVQMYAMGELSWFRYARQPMLSIVMDAHKIVRHNADGSFEYLKNRDGTGELILSEAEEKEFVFIMLQATDM